MKMNQGLVLGALSVSSLFFGVAAVAAPGGDVAFHTDTAEIRISALKKDDAITSVSVGAPMKVQFDFSDGKFKSSEGQELTIKLHSPTTVEPDIGTAGAQYSSYDHLAFNIAAVSARELVGVGGAKVAYDMYLSNNVDSAVKFKVPFSLSTTNPFTSPDSYVNGIEAFTRAGLEEFAQYVNGGALGDMSNAEAKTYITIESQPDSSLPDGAYEDAPKLYVKATWSLVV